MSFNSDCVLYPSWAAFGIAFFICISLMTIRGCENYKAAEVEIERIHFNGQYEQRMVVGYGSPIWVKIAADTIESTPDSLQQPIKLRFAPQGK
jgi:hypothetical protein